MGPNRLSTCCQVRAAKYVLINAISLFSSIVLIFSWTGCAHAPIKEMHNPRQLLETACEPGKKTQKLQGSVWLKAKSKETSGQFPALVNATAPDQLRLDVLNLLGGTEAVIQIQGKNYQVDVTDQKKRSEKGSGSWGGIPLLWATELFLGRIPCPDLAALSDARLILSSEGGLEVETPASLDREDQRFVYQFKNFEGRPWADSLIWQKKGAMIFQVEFKFDDPENGTRSPRRWEAKSSHGEVKVRWREREVL